MTTIDDSNWKALSVNAAFQKLWSMENAEEERIERLEKALLDQKLRAERHRSNFEALKAEHLLLQESHQNKKAEYETLAENYDLLHHKSHNIIQQLQSERDQKIIECETVRSKVLSGAKLENYRAHLSVEAAEPHRKRANASERELDDLREKYKKLMYDHAMLGSNFESLKLNQNTALKEITAKHKMELECLEESHRKLLANQSINTPSSDLCKIRKLERELIEVRQKLKMLKTDNERLTAEKERTEEHSKQCEQGLSRQLAEVQYLNKSLELERSNLTSQTQSLQSELSQTYEKHHMLLKKVAAADRQLAEANRKLEEADHRLQRELADLEMRLTEQRQCVERERETYRLEVVACKAQIESLTEVLHKQDAMLADKELQVERRVQSSREQEWEKQRLLQQEKIDLEEKVAELEREQVRCKEEWEAKLLKVNSALTEATAQADTIEADLNFAKGREQELMQKLQSVQEEAEASGKVNRKYQAVCAENRSLKALEAELKESFKQWEAIVERLEGQLRKTKQEAAMAVDLHQEEMKQAKQSWVEEKEVLCGRIEECEMTMKSSSQQLEEARREMKKIQKQQRKQVALLKDKLELSEAEKKQVVGEREATVTALKLESKKLRRQLAEVQRKSKEFFLMLQTDPTKLSRAHRKNNVEQQLERELVHVSGQMEELEACQAHQLRQEHQALLRAALDTRPTAPSDPTLLPKSSSLQMGRTTPSVQVSQPVTYFTQPPLDHSLSQ